MAILQAVMQRFSRKSDADPVPNSLASGITLSEQINRYAPLFELQERRQLIEVVCERSNQRFQSMILSIDLASGSIELDELFPTPQGQQLCPGDLLTFKHHNGGQLLTFTTPLESVMQTLDAPIYTLLLPDAVAYRQRRTYPRISLSRQQPLTVRLQSPWRTAWYATANNISCGGMRLIIGGNVLDQLEPASLIPMCEFSFHEQFNIRCQARVRGFRFIRRPYRHTEISIEFLDVAPQQKMQLQQFITEIQKQPQAA